MYCTLANQRLTDNGFSLASNAQIGHFCQYRNVSVLAEKLGVASVFAATFGGFALLLIIPHLRCVFVTEKFITALSRMLMVLIRVISGCWQAFINISFMDCMTALYTLVHACLRLTVCAVIINSLNFAFRTPTLWYFRSRIVLLLQTFQISVRDSLHTHAKQFKPT